MSNREGFEKIKSNLVDSGFEIEGDTFTKVVEKRQLVVVNGQQSEVVQQLKVQLEYIGEGWIEPEHDKKILLYGLSLKINGRLVTDFWVRNSKELFSWLK